MNSEPYSAQLGKSGGEGPAVSTRSRRRSFVIRFMPYMSDRQNREITLSYLVGRIDPEHLAHILGILEGNEKVQERLIRHARCPRPRRFLDE